MANAMEKLKNLTNSMNNTNSNSAPRRRMKDIFFNFKTGPNRVRLIGNFLEIRTHYLAPSPKTRNHGFVSAESIANKEISSMINCPDWDCQTEKWRKERTCPICKIKDQLYKDLKNPALTEEDKKRIMGVIENAKSRRALKWNIIDRNDPYALEVSESGEEKKVLSYKIATLGSEAFRDINLIFEQVKFDITDEKDGIDIDIIKTEGARVTYSVRVAMDGLKPIQSPLTEEEKKMELHNLVSVCGRQPDVEKLERALRQEYREMLDKIAAAPVVAKTASKTVEGGMPFCFGEYDGTNAECSTPCVHKDKCQEEQTIRKAEAE